MHSGLQPNERLACVGNTSELGSWNRTKARVMTLSSEGLWAATLPVTDTEVQVIYIDKYLRKSRCIHETVVVYVCVCADATKTQHILHITYISHTYTHVT